MIEADLAEYLSGDLVPGLCREPSTGEHWLLLTEFGITEVFRSSRWAFSPGPPEGSKRPRCPDHRSRPALSAVLPAVIECRGLAAGALSALDPNLPLTLLHDAAARSIEVPLAGRTSSPRWVAQVGRARPLMLDSDVEQNAGYEREVTDRLYGGGTDHRLEQEVLLGVGGVRAIRAYCRITGAPPPAVFHSNEGHAGFLGGADSRIHAERR